MGINDDEAMMTIEAPMTASSGPTKAETMSSGTARPRAESRVTMKTPLRAFSEPPTMATMMNGQRMLSGRSCKLIYVDSWTGSRPVKLARVLAGIPMEPYVVGTELATRQTRIALMGSKPRATSIDAGIAIAVPKPAIPSMKRRNPSQ